MKLSALAGAAFLLQSSLVVDLRMAARPEHLRYERALAVAAPGTGLACAVLDATVLGHTASPAHNDLRIFRRLPGEQETEIPFALTESGPEPVADTSAAIRDVRKQGNQLSLDLWMPARPYSEVRLGLNAKNFVATVTMQGRDGRGHTKELGRVPIFDLSSAQGKEQGARWTSLEPGEVNWPILHLVLEVRTPEGAPDADFGEDMVQTAEVPPSRMRQTQYVPTVSTDHLEQHGSLTEALLRVPAHVPVERVAFRFAPGYDGSFAREVTVSARADHAPVTDTEALDAGQIEQVSLASGDPRVVPIALKEDALDATLGATLVRPATVLVAVSNAGQPPLPIRSVVLEMRERRMCFFADREGSYMLRYGDAALGPPAYDEAAVSLAAQPLEARMGPEQVNPAYRVRHDAKGVLQRYPELYWLLVLFSGGMIGGTALHHVQHRRT